MPTENQNITNLNVVTGAKLEEALTQIWTAMKQYISDRGIDIETRDQILARLNAIIGGNKNYTDIAKQEQYLDEFRSQLATLFLEQGMEDITYRDLKKWISAMRMKLGTFGCFIYAQDEDDIEHFYTPSEWQELKDELSRGEIASLPNVYGAIINNSTMCRVIALNTNTSNTWGTYGVAFSPSGTAEQLLRYADPVAAKYYAGSEHVCLCESSQAMTNIIAAGEWTEGSKTYTVTQNTIFVVFTNVGQTTVAIRHYINTGTSANPHYDCVYDSDPRIGLTMECYTAQAYTYNGTSRFQVPYKDTQNIYGAPSGLYCAKYKAFSGDDSQWYLPAQNELALMCVNSAMLNQIKSVVTGQTYPSGNIWSCVQYTNLIAYYTSFPSGSTAYTSKNGSSYVVPFAAFKWRTA